MPIDYNKLLDDLNDIQDDDKENKSWIKTLVIIAVTALLVTIGYYVVGSELHSVLKIVSIAIIASGIKLLDKV